MNDQYRRELESGQRCRQWPIDYAALVPGLSIFDSRFQELTDLVGDLERIAGGASAAASEGLSSTVVKGSERSGLIAIMEPVRGSARAAEFDHPGTRDRYRYNLAMANQDLLAAGRSFATGGATDEALLHSYGAPAGWVALVTAASDDFEASFASQDSAVASRVAANADLDAKFAQLTRLKGLLRHLVKIYTAGNPGAYAAWQTAAHVERPPKKATPPTP